MFITSTANINNKFKITKDDSTHRTIHYTPFYTNISVAPSNRLDRVALCHYLILSVKNV